jgi:hypothetical protein
MFCNSTDLEQNKMIAALRVFTNDTIYDRYFSVSILPIQQEYREDMNGSIDQVRALMQQHPFGNDHVRVFESTFSADMLPRLERALLRHRATLPSIKPLLREWARQDRELARRW